MKNYNFIILKEHEPKIRTKQFNRLKLLPAIKS